jgi:hypothetical protein
MNDPEFEVLLELTEVAIAVKQRMSVTEAEACN